MKTVVWAMACAALGACGGGGENPAAVDGGGPDAPADGDGNEAFDEAIPVDVDGAGQPGVIDVPGDRDYFVFELEAGAWIELSAFADDLETDLYPIVTLFDANRTQVAQGGIVDTHVAVSGTYYAAVEDFSSLYDLPKPIGGPEHTYTFTVSTLRDGVNGVVIDAEPGDFADSAQPLAGSGGFVFGTVLGLFDHAGDVDVFSVELTDASTQVFLMFADLSGPEGNGSTADIGRAWVTDASGSTVLARVEDAVFFGLEPPLEGPGTYLLWIEKAPALDGSNDFYGAFVLTGFPDDVVEKETASGENDTIALADASDETVTLSGSPPSVFFRSHLPAGDVDYIGFQVGSAVTVQVTCLAEQLGSGLRGLRVDLRDADDAVLASLTEDGGGALSAALPAAGRYYLRLSATGQDPEVVGDWLRCIVEIPSL